MMISFREGVRSVVKHRHLTLEMAKRDLSDRYAGQLLGQIWGFVHPLAMMGIFLFVFGVVFQAKASNLDISFPADHAVYLVSGLLPWLVAVEVFTRSPTLVSGHATLAKQVVFPLEVLPPKMVLATLPTLLIGMVGLSLYVLVRFQTLPLTYLAVPIAALILYMFLLGVSFLISSIAVFFRDLKDIVQLYALAGLYLAPIFYFVDWVPEDFRFIVFLNPMTYFIMMFHDLLYYGSVQSLPVWIGAGVIALLTLVLGGTVFVRTKTYFGSYL